MKEARLGGKLRRLRQERRLNQAQMAEQLGISASYLNLLEHNQRPLTVPVLLRLARNFAIDLQEFAADSEDRLAADLMEALADPLFDGFGLKTADIKDLVGHSPAIGRALLGLYQAYRGGRTTSRPAADQADEIEGMDIEVPTGMPSEEVSDFIQEHGNYFGELEAAADQLWADGALSLDTLYRGLVDVLASRYSVDVAVLPAGSMEGVLREYNPLLRRLQLSEMLPPPSRTFQLAHQIAWLGCRPAIDELASKGRFSTAEAERLARVALANYFAAALMMPYRRFLADAKSTRYDIDVLSHRFGVSFEQVCHRLATLQRPGEEGIPFHLVRVDIAGNISKRFSKSGIHIARFGAACPRWNVYDAFSTPGMIRTQISEMPDGGQYFCVARTVTRPGRPRAVLGQRVGQLAVGLGCPLSYAREIVHADGLPLDNPAVVTRIGVSCSVCERTDCVDRAMPSVHQKINVDENRRGVSVYSTPA